MPGRRADVVEHVLILYQEKCLEIDLFKSCAKFVSTNFSILYLKIHMYVSGTMFAFSSKEHEDCVLSSGTTTFDIKEEVKPHKISHQCAKVIAPA